MREIEVIAIFSPDRLPSPIRFRIVAEDESFVVVKIGKILFAEEQKKEQKIKYRCQCTINSQKRIVDIFFWKPTMQWFLDV